MRLPLLIVLTAVLISTVVDLYLYYAIKKRTKSRKLTRAHLIFAALMLVYIVVGVSMPRQSGSDAALMSIMWMLYSYFTVYLPKWFFIAFDLIACIPKLWKGKRVKFISRCGIAVAVATFALMWWGSIFNRYNIDVNEVDIEISNLPPNFDGYCIAQISDMHVGSFDKDSVFLSEVVEEINRQNVDAIVFTGDIVNRRTEELPPYAPILSRLKAKDGVYSVLGNHDYGDYNKWESSEAKKENLEALKRMQKEMGWTLLLNETEILRRGNDSIALIGVENWGDPPFTVYGDLKKSYNKLNDNVVKILLSHNPAHWEGEIMNKEDVNIALTLSGHTHAMQIELFGYSPARWRYKYWGGEYADSLGHTLYVNIGISTVALPARIGATPEITVFTLKQKK